MTGSPASELCLHRANEVVCSIKAKRTSAEVIAAADAYVRAMASEGVLPVIKHFPGLGRLNTDTHVSDANLRARLAVLRRSDWLPFQALADEAAVMVGHAIVPAIDTQPASISRKLVTGVLRDELGHAGRIFTDDLCMAPTYRRGAYHSARAALAAGADGVLVTYDLDVVYEILAEAGSSNAGQRSRLVNRVVASPAVHQRHARLGPRDWRPSIGVRPPRASTRLSSPRRLALSLSPTRRTPAAEQQPPN